MKAIQKIDLELDFGEFSKEAFDDYAETEYRHSFNPKPSKGPREAMRQRLQVILADAEDRVYYTMNPYLALKKERDQREERNCFLETQFEDMKRVKSESFVIPKATEKDKDANKSREPIRFRPAKENREHLSWGGIKR